MTAERKKPQRTCVGCGEIRDKRELIRILRTPEGEFTVDATGRKNGRGAYLCRKEECLTAAFRNHGLERSFRTAIPPEVTERLREELRALGT